MGHLSISPSDSDIMSNSVEGKKIKLDVIVNEDTKMGDSWQFAGLSFHTVVRFGYKCFV